jgi:glucosamine kinase
MKLIVDSGSTKTFWCLVQNNQVVQEIYTAGINPYTSSSESIHEIIKNKLLSSLLQTPSEIYYYGAGCSTEHNKQIINKELLLINPSAKIQVEHDLLAVARGLCLYESGIAVILGTGSNSCLYDGTTIVQQTPSLGYVLGDEGSGAYLGKLILSDVWYSLLPGELRTDFFIHFPENLSYYLTKIYKEPSANSFLASFVLWLSKHKSHTYVQKLLRSSFDIFIQKHIKPYGVDTSKVIHATGSIAFNFRDEWKDVILQHGYQVGTIEQVPMNGLIQYHK